MLTGYIDGGDYKFFKEQYRNQFYYAKLHDISLAKALDHCLSLAGGFVRAQMVIASFKSYDIDKAYKVNLAIAIEYFQLSSLILDDLPCMDNAEIRRGQQCVHLKYGQSDAILSSLALINRAHTLLWSFIGSCERETQRQCTSLVDSCLGISGIILGQAVDLNYNSKLHDEEYIKNTAELKTTSLFKLAVILPLIIMNKQEVVINFAEKFIKSLGEIYQLIDDLKDYYLSKHAHLQDAYVENLFIVGKKSRDKELDRPNLIYRIGIESSHRKLEELFSSANEHTKKILELDPSLSFYKVIISAMEEKYKYIVDSVNE